MAALVALASILPALAGCDPQLARDVRSAAYETFQAGVDVYFTTLTGELTTGIREVASGTPAGATTTTPTAGDAATAGAARR